ncbi:hypothetical protein BS78_02G189000 [Paspalum vaginatum]|nr:hypothetical protein BS78_02G189000 [Paspalum vaginatum]
MTRRAMFTVGKKKSIRGVAAAAQMSRRPPFQHMALRRLRELKKIVPDAQDADVDVLLRRTAEYICVLELKVTVLRRLSTVYGV